MNGVPVESEAWPKTPALQPESPTPAPVDLMAPFASSLFPSVKISAQSASASSLSSWPTPSLTLSGPVSGVGASKSDSAGNGGSLLAARYSADSENGLARDDLSSEGDADSEALSPSLNATLPPFLSFMTSDDRVLSPSKPSSGHGLTLRSTTAAVGAMPTVHEPLAEDSHHTTSALSGVHLNGIDSASSSTSGVTAVGGDSRMPSALLSDINGDMEWDDELDADLGAYDEGSGSGDILV
jgi:hypothetical protein